MATSTLIAAGIILVFLGMLLIVGGTLLSLKTSNAESNTSVKGGAVVFIGPIPIIFGSDKNSAIAVAVIVLLLMAAYFFFLNR
ncbi:MAG: DUF131 domain-containing protein [Candidatus Altiarchaeota archaeon]